MSLPAQTAQRASAGGSQAKVIPLSGGGTLRYATRGNSTLVRISPAASARANRAGILLARDETVAPRTPVLQFRVIGEKAQGVYIVSDSYASKAGGMSYCQAGEEQFVRVLARPGGWRQTFSIKVASCREQLELGVEGVSWDASTSSFTVDWLKGPAAAHSTQKRFVVDGQGQVTPE